MAAWPLKQLDELCEVTSSKRIYANELCPSGVPFFRSKEIIEKLNGQDTHTNPLFISEDRFQEILRTSGAPIRGDVLLTSRGTLGIPYIVKESDRFHFADGNLTWFRRFQHLDSHYLKYFFDSPLGKAELSKCVIGSSQAAYTIVSLKKVKIPLPAMGTQRRIATILSVYDELIENCQRRIRILEAMARAFCREWRIQFCEQNENAGRTVSRKSSDCLSGTLGDLCDLTKHAFDDAEHSELPLLDLAHMPSRTLAPQDTGSPSELTTSRIVFKKGDTLFGAIRCYLHKVVAAPYSGVTNTSVLVLRPKKPCYRALLAIIASDPETIRWAETQSTGTKMPVINWGIFSKMPAPVPSEALAQEFEMTAGQMLDQIGVHASQIQNLLRTRDLLLPRLLSGQVNLKEN